MLTHIAKILKHCGGPIKIAGGGYCLAAFCFFKTIQPHVAAATKELLAKFKWKVFEHPVSSPNLTPSYYHMFCKLGELLGGKNFASDKELQETVTSFFTECGGI